MSFPVEELSGKVPNFFILVLSSFLLLLTIPQFLFLFYYLPCGNIRKKDLISH